MASPSEQVGFASPKVLQIGVVVHRADGTVEDLGVVSDSRWHFWSPRRWVAFFRIKRANRRNERRG